MENYWQKCPVCNGKGFTEEFIKMSESSALGGYVMQHTSCHVCNGKGIIDLLTGKPPVDGNENKK